MLVNGSLQLVDALREHDLVYEYRLMVFPVVLGAGKRLVSASRTPTDLRAVDATKAGDCLIVVYETGARETKLSLVGSSSRAIEIVVTC